jgi:hypothetical protein
MYLNKESKAKYKAFYLQVSLVIFMYLITGSIIVSAHVPLREYFSFIYFREQSICFHAYRRILWYYLYRNKFFFFFLQSCHFRSFFDYSHIWLIPFSMLTYGLRLIIAVPNTLTIAIAMSLFLFKLGDPAYFSDTIFLYPAIFDSVFVFCFF